VISSTKVISRTRTTTAATPRIAHTSASLRRAETLAPARARAAIALRVARRAGGSSSASGGGWWPFVAPDHRSEIRSRICNSCCWSGDGPCSRSAASSSAGSSG
jgi:hypothetical protein